MREFNETLTLRLIKLNVASMLKYSLNYVITHYKQIVKFTSVGFTTFGIYVLSFHIFYGHIKLDYRVAVSIAYIITIISHFLLHRTFTYHATEQALIHNIWKYLLMLVINYFITLIVIWFVVDIINHSPYIGLIASTAVTAFISFFAMKYFVFD